MNFELAMLFYTAGGLVGFFCGWLMWGYEMKFVAIRHNWFGTTRGWNVHELEAESERLAEMEAAHIQAKYESKFNHCSVKVYKIKEGNDIIQPRKLSWKERLTGWTKEFDYEVGK